MYCRVVLCFALLSITNGQVFEQSLLKYLNQGAVRGHRSANYDVFEFLNIPYATAPTGVDKFKAPLPPPSWNGTLDAVDRGIVCHQPETTLLPPNFQMLEDCLVANVYVPDTQETSLPVLVIVHGGAYIVGHGASDSPIALVNSKKILAVTFNYRLGIPGFLCLGTEQAPGNAGMKDQVALLRWVRENINRFGGNPEDVTIAGCSAGGSSVDTHLLSNMTRGLFHKVIAESGCTMSPWTIQYDPIQTAIDHARHLNFSKPDNTTALGEFYTSLSWQNLVEPTWQYLVTKNSHFQFVPCVEKDLGQEMFLEKAPISILGSGDFLSQPMLYGYASMEGLLRAEIASEWIETMNTNFSDFLTLDLIFENEQQRDQVANKVKDFYFGAGAVNESHILSFIDYFSDVMIIHSILRTIPYHVGVGNNQVYLYEYAFTHNNSLQIPFTNVTGAMHCDQFSAAIGNLGENPSEELQEMSKIMGEIYINFITSGNPNSQAWNAIPHWPVVGPNRSPYLHIDNNVTQVIFDGNAAEDLANRTSFWDTLYAQYGTRIPVAPKPSSAHHLVLSHTLIACTILFALLGCTMYT